MTPVVTVILLLVQLKNHLVQLFNVPVLVSVLEPKSGSGSGSVFGSGSGSKNRTKM